MKHNLWDVALIQEVRGLCKKCKHRTSAKLVAYYDKTILVRCNNCNTANEFDIEDKEFNDPRKFSPFLDDNEED